MLSNFDIRRKLSDSRSSSNSSTDLVIQKSSLDVTPISQPSLLPVSPSMNSNNGLNRCHSGDSRRSSMVDATGRFCSQPMSGYAEILVGLCYDDKHETVSVAIEKASSLGDQLHPPDSFVRIIGLEEFNGEVSRHKTETVKHTIQPAYNYHCQMRFSKEKVETSTIRIEIWTVSGLLRRKQQIGSISIGYASSTPDANEHWQQMMQSAGITVSKWHAIQAPDT